MENQTHQKITLSLLVGLMVIASIFLICNTNQKQSNEASIVDLQNEALKKIQYNIDGEVIDTYLDTKTGQAATEFGDVDTTEVISKTIKYLNDYFGEANTVSLQKIEEDESSSLYKLAFKIGDKESSFYVTKDGEKIFMGDALNLNKAQDREVIGGFFERDNEVQLINNKIPVYFFGVSDCEHSKWELDVINAIEKKFKDEVVIYNYMDSDENENYFFEYSDGSMPLIIIADKYFRIGSGEKIGKQADFEAISNIITNLK